MDPDSSGTSEPAIDRSMICIFAQVTLRLFFAEISDRERTIRQI